MIRPPAGLMIPDKPSDDKETKPKPAKPLLEGELPGLPDDEPTPPKSPGKNKSSNMMPVPQETPRQAAARDAGTVTLVANTDVDPGNLPPGVRRADAIGVVPSPMAREIERVGYSPSTPSAGREGVGPKTTTAALNGYCPVELSLNGRWVLGDLRWTVVHRGMIFRLSGPEQRQRFLADPDRFVPANAGNDVVMTVAQNRTVPGQTKHCAIYRDRLYMFSSVETQFEFNKRPDRYAVGK